MAKKVAQVGHPQLTEVLVNDITAGVKFPLTMCLEGMKAPTETEEFEGRSLPVIKVSLTSHSHPFFTNSDKSADTLGKIAQFNARYTKKQAAAKVEAPIAPATNRKAKR